MFELMYARVQFPPGIGGGLSSSLLLFEVDYFTKISIKTLFSDCPAVEIQIWVDKNVDILSLSHL